MTTKQDAQAKITAAEKASTTARQAWAAAASSLGGGASVNGYGIFHDPSQLEGKLLDARQHIEDALAAMRGVSWPTNAEYDQAES